MNVEDIRSDESIATADGMLCRIIKIEGDQIGVDVFGQMELKYISASEVSRVQGWEMVAFVDRPRFIIRNKREVHEH